MSEETGNRIIDLINFFAAHPTEAFTLSDVVEHLPISLGSAHRALKALTDARYLSRHPRHKTYSLGLTLVAIGQAALERHPAVSLAREEMSRLTAELGLQCVATTRVDDELVSLVKTGVPPGDHGIRRAGERRPFIPPLGLGHVAWAGAETTAAYLARGAARPDHPTHGFLLKSLEVIRQRGYAMAANGPAVRSVWQAIWDQAARLRDERYWEQMRRLLAGLSRDELQLLTLDQPGAIRLAYISAPVFSPGGEVLLSISMSGFAEELDADTVSRHVERLCAAAATVTQQIHGQLPR
ncbi:IclR family transcriptional regulator [Hydrocarboniphaga sp.]|uniref:IclR family transcriptional regulator n=1 Tax=Hydrocarboniphaga sp. TaxID=2033016 RepID=UPI003D0D3CB1